MPWLQMSAVLQVLLSAFLVTLVLMHSGREAGMGGLGFTPHSQGGTHIVERNLTRLTVAVGRMDFNGTPGIIVGTGPGVAATVVRFDAAGNRVLSFQPYSDDFLGGVRVATADTNGDGADEILTGPGAGTTPDVRVFKSDGTGINALPTISPTFRGGLMVAGRSRLSATDPVADLGHETV